MTTYELADLAQNQFANSVSTFTVFLSIVFAYIVTAYVVGARLTRMQVSMLSFVFVTVSILLIWSVAAYTSGATNLNRMAFPDSHDNFFAAKIWFPSFVIGQGSVILGITWLLR